MVLENGLLDGLLIDYGDLVVPTVSGGDFDFYSSGSGGELEAITMQLDDVVSGQQEIIGLLSAVMFFLVFTWCAASIKHSVRAFSGGSGNDK